VTLVLKALGIESNEEIKRLFTVEKTERMSIEQLRSVFEQVEYRAAEPLLDARGKEIIKEGAVITEKALSLLENHGVSLFMVSSRQPDRWIIKTLSVDKTANQEEAVKQIFKEIATQGASYRRGRPEPPVNTAHRPSIQYVCPHWAIQNQ